MELPKLGDKGQVVPTFTLVAMAIALFIGSIVLGEMGTSFTSALATSTEATAGFNNVTSYVWVGMRIISVGLLVYAGMNIFGLFGARGGRRR